MYTVEQYANTLYEVLEDTHPKNHHKVIDNFIAILTENNDNKLYPEIIEEVKKINQQKKDIKKVEITTASQLDIKEEKKILEELNSCLGNDIELKKIVDKGIISGLVVKVNDVVIDGSVKRRIENLKSEITK